jgi:NAD(P)-dependent dehydrogenase (short-subunit alcohol dehydrogenase family)
VSLTGKTALVTGAAAGMGAATARAFAAAGASVVGADVSDAAGNELFAELGAPHRYTSLDVGSAEAWSQLTASLDRLDIAFLNAGVMTRPPEVPILDDPVEWLDHERFRRVMRVNVDGVGLGLAATIPLLEAAGGGDIVVTSSGAGIRPYEADPVYSASKYALVGLGRSFAPSLARRGIRINVLCPHSVLTGLIPKDLRELPDKVFSSPEYIAESVLRILAAGETGGVWVARSVDEPAWPVEFHDPIPQPSYLAAAGS